MKLRVTWLLVLALLPAPIAAQDRGASPTGVVERAHDRLRVRVFAPGVEREGAITYSDARSFLLQDSAEAEPVRMERAAVSRIEQSVGVGRDRRRALGLGVLGGAAVGALLSPTSAVYGAFSGLLVGIPAGLVLGQFDVRERWTPDLSPEAARLLIAEGRRVRLSVAGTSGKPVVGTLEEVTGDGLSLRVDGASESISMLRREISQLEVANGDKKSRTVPFIAGLLIGAGVGTIAGYAAEGCVQGVCTGWERALLLGFEFGMAGGVLGAVAFPRHTERWRPATF